jgi:hypothetical protein
MDVPYRPQTVQKISHAQVRAHKLLHAHHIEHNKFGIRFEFRSLIENDMFEIGRQ